MILPPGTECHHGAMASHQGFGAPPRSRVLASYPTDEALGQDGITDPDAGPCPYSGGGPFRYFEIVLMYGVSNWTLVTS